MCEMGSVMSIGRPLLRRFSLAACLCLSAGVPLLHADDATPPPAKKVDLGDAFQKGPIALDAKVIRSVSGHPPEHLPLFQVPVLRYEDQVQISLSGEAFDPRVTQADWTLVVVFLPRTVAPTDRGVVELRLKRKGDAMVAAPFKAPYDAIPMFFLVPDTGGRRKILTDLSAHLDAFRSICLKLSDLTEQRAHADQFLAGLNTIQQNQSPASYDSSLFNFLKAYGAPVSQDFQVFLASNDTSNLAKFQFLTQEFTRTNLLSPGSDSGGDGSVSLQDQSVSGPMRPASAYVAIAFDLVQIFQNLWPGHQFQYVPALARDFKGSHAELWYGDWIHTTGAVRGALVFSPCRWKDAELPAFTFDLPADGNLLQPFGRLQIHPKAKSNQPFALYGHDWRLVLEGPKGAPALAPLPLAPSPDHQSFMILPGPAQDALRKADLLQVQAHIEGAWGFEPVASPGVALPAGLDPTWRPTGDEKDHFMEGQACHFRLPGPWAACVGRVIFRPAQGGSSLEAKLEAQPDGSRLAAFTTLAGPPGPGTLELRLSGSEQPSLSVPLRLLPPLPVVDHVEAHQGENSVLVVGSHLSQATACRFGDLVLQPGQRTREGWTFVAAKGTLPGEAGSLLQGALHLGDGRVLSLKDVLLLPPRPQLGVIQVIPERAPKGLPLTADHPLIPPDEPVLISILSGRKGAYPFGHKPQLRFRATDDPETIHPLPPKHLRMVGRGERLLASLRMSDLIGSSGAGHLEVQVADAKAGASAWVPLQPLFLELPVLKSVQLDGTASRLMGPSLETIEAVAPAPTGPWTPFSFSFQEAGEESGPAPAGAPDGSLFLKLYGWPDLAVRLQGPVPPKAVPAPTPSIPVPTAPIPPKPPVVTPPQMPQPPATGKGGPA